LFLDTFVSLQAHGKLKSIHIILCMLLGLSPGAFFCHAQPQLRATVHGTVLDEVTFQPLEGALIALTSMDGKAQTTVTNARGEFTLELPPGRYTCEVSLLGYEGSVQEALAASGRDLILKFNLKEHSTQLEGVTITSRNVERDEEITLPIEKVLRMPANFFDPIRMLSSFPSVIAANDQANNIIVKGTSPSGLLWRLNGMDIVNPNHLANAGTINDKPTANGGGVNILSAQMLDRTSFYSGNMPARYGNVTSGVLDMTLRDGNFRKREYTAQASLLGLDIAAEGPLTKSGNSSFLANYRYSTVGLLSHMGVNFGGEAITFQDLSFHFRSKVGAAGSISFFGLGGISSNRFEKRDPEEWEVDKDRFDIFYKSNMGAMGARYDQRIGSLNLSAGATISSNNQSREASSDDTPAYPDLAIPAFPGQSSLYESTRTLISSFAAVTGALSETVSLDAGVMVNLTQDKLYSEETLPNLSATVLADGDRDFMLIQPYAQFTARIGSFSFDAGGRYLISTLEDARSFDYRAQLTYGLTENMMLSATGGQVSQLHLPGVYMAAGNQALGFMHKQFAELAHTLQVSKWKFTTTAYYHYFDDVPVSSLPRFSVINMMDGVAPSNLVKEGTGTNKGISLQAERSFLSSFYVLAGGSVYRSTFTDMEDVSYSTRFDGRHSLMTTVGYEKSRDKEDARSAFGVHTRFMWLGGLRESVIDEYWSRVFHTTVRDLYSYDPYARQFKDYYRVDLRVSWRKDKGKYTRTVAIDVQNVLGLKNEAFNYFDTFQDKIVTQYQVGIIPVLVYRIDF
jgi:hypothetical protein